jgi:hypothetical protein
MLGLMQIDKSIDKSMESYPLTVPHEAPPFCDLVHGNNHTLLLDLDTPQQVQQFVKLLTKVDDFYPFHRIRIWASRTKGTHVELKLREALREEEIGLLQLVLGSDPVRGWFLHLRLRAFVIEDANVLFKPQRSPRR